MTFYETKSPKLYTQNIFYLSLNRRPARRFVYFSDMILPTAPDRLLAAKKKEKNSLFFSGRSKKKPRIKLRNKKRIKKRNLKKLERDSRESVIT